MTLWTCSTAEHEIQDDRTIGQQRKPTFQVNVRQATIVKNNLVTLPHLCVQDSETQQQSLGCPSFRVLNDKMFLLADPYSQFAGGAGCNQDIYWLHVKVNRGLSLKHCRALYNLLSMSTTESAGCPKLAMTGQGLWNNTCHGILQHIDSFFPSTIFILFLENSLNDQISTSWKGKTIPQGRYWMPEANLTLNNTNNEGVWNYRKKKGLLFLGVNWNWEYRIRGSYFPGYERNSCNCNKISRSWGVYAVLLRTIF